MIIISSLLVRACKGRQEGPVLVDGWRHETHRLRFPKRGGSKASLFEQFLSVKAQVGCHKGKILGKTVGCHLLEADNGGIGLSYSFGNQVASILPGGDLAIRDGWEVHFV